MTHDDLLRKISALLAKAEGTDNEAEAAAFMDKATELMTRHMIDEAQIREARGRRSADDRPVKIDFQYSPSDSNAVGKKHLLHNIARSSWVRMVDYPNHRYGNVGREGNSGVASQWCALVGFREDLDMVRTLYASLLVQGARLARIEWVNGAGPRAKMPSKYLTGFLVGFAGRVGERLREARDGVIRETNTSALVAVKDPAVDEVLGEHFPRLGHGRSHRVDYAGQVAGRRAGDRADVGLRRVGGAARQLGAGR